MPLNKETKPLVNISYLSLFSKYLKTQIYIHEGNIKEKKAIFFSSQFHT